MRELTFLVYLVLGFCGHCGSFPPAVAILPMLRQQHGLRLPSLFDFDSVQKDDTLSASNGDLSHGRGTVRPR